MGYPRFFGKGLVAPLGGGWWRLEGSLVYRRLRQGSVYDDPLARLVIPHDFVTDFAAFPRCFRAQGLPPGARYRHAALLLDWVYERRPCDRRTADRLLYEALRASGCGRWRASCLYLLVRLRGAAVWASAPERRRIRLSIVSFLRQSRPFP